MSDNVTRLSTARRRAREERIARSEYGQIRLTVTFQPTGTSTFRALAKKPQEDWRELHVFAQGREVFAAYPPDFHSALEMFAQIAERLRWMPGDR